MGYITSKKKEPAVLDKRKLLKLIVFGVLCLLGALVLVLVDPIKLLSKYYGRISNGSYVHELLKKESPGIHLSAYLFNITNADQFVSGEDLKLKVEEVGPFTYQEFLTHRNMEIDEDAGVMRYIPHIKSVFLPEYSIARPEDVQITMPNIAMLSVASKVSQYSYLPRMGFNLLTGRLDSKPIVKMTVKDYLWGYDEPLIKLGNTIMPEIVDFDILGILDRLYDKKAKFNFELSLKEEDKFVIKSVNGNKGLNMWEYEKPEKRSSCNSFANSYEGIAYPPNLQSDRPIKIYRNILCRFLELDFIEKKTTEYGVDGLFYKISNKTFTKNNSTDCLCSKGVCTEGISDMAPCFYGLPLVISNAHFMHADPKIYDRVDGIRPNEELHGSDFAFDPKLGLVLTTKFAVQVNILVRDVTFNHEASKFSDMIVPVAYFKVMQPPLEDEAIFNLRFVYIYGPYIVLSLQTLFAFAGLVLLAYAARMLYGTYPERKNIQFHVKLKEKPSVEQPLMP